MVFSRHRLSPAEGVELARADRASVHLVVRGRVELTARDGLMRLAGAGDLVLADVGQSPVRARAVGEPGELVSAEFVGHAVPDLVHFAASEVRHEPALAALADLLRRAPSDPGAHRLASTLLDPLVAYALHATGRSRAEPADRRVARALAAMQERLDERWSVAALAKVAGLSRAAFARRFLAEVGTPPLRHLYTLRMRRAQQLLLETDESLASIAARIGYDSEFAFSRAFRRAFGEAPGAFRRRSTTPVMRAAA
jgi:AraC-like DNA-binding protein